MQHADVYHGTPCWVLKKHARGGEPVGSLLGLVLLDWPATLVWDSRRFTGFVPGVGVGSHRLGVVGVLFEFCIVGASI
ncbi:hypothetical protein GCM10023223_53440 [Stackebrandtia albiflava]